MPNRIESKNNAQFELAQHDRSYLNGLEAQYNNPQHKQIIIGQNFILSALMAEIERMEYLGVVPHEKLKYNVEYLDKAKKLKLILHPMDAGLGTSVVREGGSCGYMGPAEAKS